jgi:hypothetical protein
MLSPAMQTGLPPGRELQPEVAPKYEIGMDGIGVQVGGPCAITDGAVRTANMLTSNRLDAIRKLTIVFPWTFATSRGCEVPENGSL